MFSILLSSAGKRDDVRAHLENNGVETRPVFYPAHTMPMYSRQFQRHPTAEDIGWRGINIPSYPDLTQDDVAEICGIISKAPI
jgi:perosamine synthetase